jgi:flagellar biosynthetic protein FliQ/type III secretion protein S
MTATLLHLGREALLVALLVSAPPLLAALLVGLVTGLLQAATQLQEHAIGAVPRIAAVIAALVVVGPWMGARLARFAAEVLALAAGGVP